MKVSLITTENQPRRGSVPKMRQMRDIQCGSGLSRVVFSPESPSPFRVDPLRASVKGSPTSTPPVSPSSSKTIPGSTETPMRREAEVRMRTIMEFISRSHANHESIQSVTTTNGLHYDSDRAYCIACTRHHPPNSSHYLLDKPETKKTNRRGLSYLTEESLTSGISRKAGWWQPRPPRRCRSWH